MKKTLLILLVSIIIAQPALAIRNGLEGASIYPKAPNVIKPEYLSLEVKPGESASDYLVLENTSDTPEEIELYTLDSFVDKDNKKKLKSPEQEQKEFGVWATIEQNNEVKKSVILQPKEKTDLKITVNVPANTPEKDYIGGIGITKKTSDAGIAPGTMKIRLMISNPVYFKVTNNPLPIEKLPPPPLVTPTQAYLYISISLFLVALVWIIIKTIRDKKQNLTKNSK